jgi:Bardet-Biedl syndrome 2 protein
VENNRDIFDKEVTDGVNCLCFGMLPQVELPLVVAGGNCSLTGFDKHGEERFWTVTGDNVEALEFQDFDEDGEEELLVGSDDQSIRVFKGEEMLFDIGEQSKILHLRRIGSRTLFAFALANGAYGVYYGKKRLWRQKAKARVTALLGVDFDIEGQCLVVVGFASGLIEARRHRTGELMHEARMPACVVQLFHADYRQEGIPQVIAVDAEGEVKGLSLIRNSKQFQVEAPEVVEQRELEDKVLELNQRRIELLNQIEALANRKEARKALKEDGASAATAVSNVPSRQDLVI